MHRAAQIRCRTIAISAIALAIPMLATQVAPAADLAGCWTGHWESCTTGHTGPLEAMICRINSSQYRADFRGRFFKVVPFRYSVTLDVVREDAETVELAGSSYLGRLFGTFHYRAHATAGQFTADYYSCNDAGRFVLCRSAHSGD